MDRYARGARVFTAPKPAETQPPKPTLSDFVNLIAYGAVLAKQFGISREKYMGLCAIAFDERLPDHVPESRHE